jgi:hypothetical protein
MHSQHTIIAQPTDVAVTHYYYLHTRASAQFVQIERTRKVVCCFAVGTRSILLLLIKHEQESNGERFPAARHVTHYEQCTKSKNGTPLPACLDTVLK